MTEQLGVIAEQAQAPWARPAPPEPATTAIWPEHWDLPLGILPRQRLREAERLGIVTTNASEIPDDSFQPASLDLLLGPVAFRIGASFLPGDCTVKERLSDLQLDKAIDIRPGAILEPNRPYLIPLMEGLHLPQNVRAFANPKSSTGRVDIFTRVVTDHSHRFDAITAGYEGTLWLEVFSRSFLVKVHAGLALSQLRLIVTGPPSDPEPLSPAADKTVRIRLRPAFYEREPGMDGRDGPVLVGFKAKPDNSALLDLARTDHDPSKYWDPIPPSRQIKLERDAFYLFRSRERIVIAQNMAAEMVAFDPTMGELRAHYAGFFDPGFGAEIDDEYGAPDDGMPAVLEVRADVPFMIEDGQEVARLRHESLVEPPDQLYGPQAGSHYAGPRQWRFLSKHFKPWQKPFSF